MFDEVVPSATGDKGCIPNKQYLSTSLIIV